MPGMKTHVSGIPIGAMKTAINVIKSVISAMIMKIGAEITLTVVQKNVTRKGGDLSDDEKGILDRC